MPTTIEKIIESEKRFIQFLSVAPLHIPDSGVIAGFAGMDWKLSVRT